MHYAGLLHEEECITHREAHRVDTTTSNPSKFAYLGDATASGCGALMASRYQSRSTIRAFNYIQTGFACLKACGALTY